jgi:hypothetical protein
MQFLEAQQFRLIGLDLETHRVVRVEIGPWRPTVHAALDDRYEVRENGRRVLRQARWAWQVENAAGCVAWTWSLAAAGFDV